MIKAQVLHLIILIKRFLGLMIVMSLEVLDFSPHISSLCLDKLDFLVNVTSVLSELNVLVSLLVRLLSQSSQLEEFLVEHPLGPL